MGVGGKVESWRREKETGRETETEMEGGRERVRDRDRDRQNWYLSETLFSKDYSLGSFRPV